MSLVVYSATASENPNNLATLASNAGGWVIAETECTYAAIVVCDGDMPSSINFPNSGTTNGTAPLVGGLIPVVVK